MPPRLGAAQRAPQPKRLRYGAAGIECRMGPESYFPPLCKSSKQVTLSALVQSPSVAAAVKVEARTSKRFSPSKAPLKTLTWKDTLNALHVCLGTRCFTRYV